MAAVTVGLLRKAGPITDPYLTLVSCHSIPPNPCGHTSNVSGTTSSALVTPTAGSAISGTPQVYFYKSCGNLSSCQVPVAVSGVQTQVIVNGIAWISTDTVLSTSNLGGGLTVIFTSPTQWRLRKRVRSVAWAISQIAAPRRTGHVRTSRLPPDNASNPFRRRHTSTRIPPLGALAEATASTYNRQPGMAMATRASRWDVSGAVYLPNADFTFSTAQ